jgi:Sulfotransferase family
MSIICKSHKLLFIMVPGTGCSVLGNALISELGGEWLPKKNVVGKDGKIICHQKHNTVGDLFAAGVISEIELDGYTIFATARNPLDRLTTYYQRLVGDWTQDSDRVIQNQLARMRDDYSDDEFTAIQAGISKKGSLRKRRAGLMRLFGFNNWAKYRAWKWNRELLPRTAEFEQKAILTLYPMLEGVHLAIRYERLEQGLNELLRTKGIERQVTLPRKNVTPGKKDFRDYYSQSTIRVWQKYFGSELGIFQHDSDTGALINLDLSAISTGLK